jgi:hypothetical protein
MKVKELIKELSKLDPKSEVFIEQDQESTHRYMVLYGINSTKITYENIKGDFIRCDAIVLKIY